MQRVMLKSKIHKATITAVNLHYQGSMSIDPVLARAAKLFQFEKIHVYNLSNGERFSTYVIFGEENSREIHLNGAAAWKARQGDLVIIASYGNYDEQELRTYKPDLVFVDNNNRIFHTDTNIVDPRMPHDERLPNFLIQAEGISGKAAAKAGDASVHGSTLKSPMSENAA
ncbi:MAG: aspartate 1-decarboxylase [Deltaproteobacteria bacterium]|nr:aspartate 1-decarboxylase [Deltaproteobacteria bacterium]